MDERKATADELYKNKEFNKAVEIYLEALMGLNTEQLGDEYVNGYKIKVSSNMAMCFVEDRNYIKALSMIEQAVAVDPEYWKSYYKKGVILERTEMYDEAM